MTHLTDRSTKILLAIIESYIATQSPIGSRTVTKKYATGLSPATIRNIMADLEELGYLTQPYTSAGRIPTESGYRFYVNTLMTQRMLFRNEKFLNHVRRRLRFIEKDLSKLMKEASRTLSSLSHYLGIATLPRLDDITLRRIDFIKYERNRIFSVLISEEGIVRNRMIALQDRSLTPKTLEKIARYLNQELSGLTLKEIRSRIVSEISREKRVCNRLVLNALRLCREVIVWEAENLYYTGEISGTANLPDFANMNQIKELFRAIEEKHLMVRMLDNMADATGVQVFIGSENDFSEMHEMSIVASTYNDGTRTLGTIGIIGPTRMNYEEVIPMVDNTARTLTQILSEK